MAHRQRFCTFFLDGQFFGVPVQHVQEVISHQEMTRVPLAGKVIRGLINLRGQIVTAVDLRRRLNMTEGSTNDLPMNVVVRTGDGILSLLVDDIGDVIDLEEVILDPPPDTLQHAARGLVQGVHQLPDRLLLVLDVEYAVHAPGPVPAPEERHPVSTLDVRPFCTSTGSLVPEIGFQSRNYI